VAFSKQIGVVLSAITAVCVAYVAVGLPVPATQASVETRILPISAILATVQTTQKQILVDLSAVQRNQLRTERFTLEKQLANASSADRMAFQIRIGQIDDEIAKLTKRDESR
jgi:hypothetical protein